MGAGNDNNPRDERRASAKGQRRKRFRQYEVELLFSQTSKATVKLKARSLSEAHTKAADIQPDQVDDWNPVLGDIEVASVSEVKETRMTYERWFAKYRPIKADFRPNAAYDGCLFDIYDKEIAFVVAQPANRVWTLLDCDGKARIVQGFHYVNRLGYFVTEVEAPEDRTLRIVAD